MKLIYINSSAWDIIWGEVDFNDRRIVVINVRTTVRNNVWSNVGWNVVNRSSESLFKNANNVNVNNLFLTDTQLSDAYKVLV